MNIIAIDDEYYALEALVTIIERIVLKSGEIPQIRKASSAKKALLMISEDKPDIIFTDIRMDEVNGLDLCDYLHAHYPDIAVVIISGYADFTYAQRAIRANVLAYLTKPLNETDLEETFDLFRSGKKTGSDSSASKNSIASVRHSKPIVQKPHTPLNNGSFHHQVDQLVIRLINYYLTEKKINPLLNLIDTQLSGIAPTDINDSVDMLSQIAELILLNERIGDKKQAALSYQRLKAELEAISDNDGLSACTDTFKNILLTLHDQILPTRETITEKIIAYIDEHYYEDINLNDLALNVFFISPNHLSNLLFEKTGMRFSKYLLKIRMENALNLLLLEELSISEIAVLCGYNSESHFIFNFKRYYGKPPKKYKNKK